MKDGQSPVKQNSGVYLLNTRFLVASIPGSTQELRSCRDKKSITNSYNPQKVLVLPKSPPGAP